MLLELRAASVLTGDGQLAGPGSVTVSGESIVAVGGVSPAGPRADLRVVDLGQRALVPGLVDIHVHGGGGAEVNGGDRQEVAEAVRNMARYHAAHGVTTLLATTVSDSLERLEATVAGVRLAMDDADPLGATVAGVHLEGPWLNPVRAGAHQADALRPGSLDAFDRLQAAAEGAIRLVTLAPELPGGLDLVRRLSERGVTVAVGHTEADYGTTKDAFAAGARHVTHLFNAMPPLHHRAPGVIGAALEDDRVSVELIADGVHVHPAVVRMLLASRSGRVALVSDAVGPAGLGPGRYQLGPRWVDLARDRVTVAGTPGTLAGSALALGQAVAALSQSGLRLDALSRAASATPAAVAGASAKGGIRAGADADLAVLNPDGTVVATVLRGRVVHDPQGLLG